MANFFVKWQTSCILSHHNLNRTFLEDVFSTNNNSTEMQISVKPQTFQTDQFLIFLFHNFSLSSSLCFLSL